MSEEFSIDIDEKSIEEIKKAINYDELEARHQRFMNGTETEDDLINGIYHYKIQNDKGLDLDVVEMKYYNKILDLYNKEKEKNKELDKIKFIITDNLPPDMKYVCYCNTDFERLFGNDYISKDKIREKIKELNDLESNFFQKLIEIARKTGTLTEMTQNILQELLEERN